MNEHESHADLLMSRALGVCWHSPTSDRWACSAPPLSPAEAAIVARFEAAEPAPESYVRQHRSEDDCWCEPYAVGTLGVMKHRVREP